MDRLDRFYIDGDWVAPFGTETIAVVDPATECVVAEVAAGSAADADRAVAAARAAVAAFAAWSPLRRLQALQRLRQGLAARRDDLARAISMEMGAPLAFALEAQVGSGLAHLDATIAALPEIEFEVRRGALRIRREPIGVAALITPWNWPLNQIVCKVAPAIAAGVAMVLKPSEVAPLSGVLFAEIVAGVGLPAGAFNLAAAEAAHNSVLAATIAMVHGQSRRFWYAQTAASGTFTEGSEIHAAKLRAIAAGDEAAAAEAADGLLDYLERLTRGALDRLGPRG